MESCNHPRIYQILIRQKLFELFIRLGFCPKSENFFRRVYVNFSDLAVLREFLNTYLFIDISVKGVCKFFS